jgi:hypothetical protein
MTDIALATYGCIFFSVFWVDSLSPAIGVSFFSGNALLIGFPVARGLIVTDGKDGATKARRKG